MATEPAIEVIIDDNTKEAGNRLDQYMNKFSQGAKKLVGDNDNIAKSFQNVGQVGKSAFGDLTNGLKGALPEMGAFEGLLGTIGGLLGGVTAGIALVGLALAGGAFQAGELADRIADTSAKIGVSTGFLQQMEGVVKLTGGSTDAFANSMGKLNVKIGEAVQGNKAAQDAFKALGVNVKNSSGQIKSQEQVFEEVRTKLSQIENGSERAAVAQDIFGKGAKDLAGVFAQSQADYEKMVQLIKTYAVASDEAIQASGKLGDGMDVLSQTFEAGMIEAFAPVAEVLGELALKAVPYLGAAMDGLGVIVEVCMEAFSAFWDIVSGVFTIIGDVAKLITNVLGGALDWLSKAMGGTGASWDNLWTNMKAIVAITIGGMTAAWAGLVATIQYGIIAINNALADSWFGKKMGLETQKQVDIQKAYNDQLKKTVTGIMAIGTARKKTYGDQNNDPTDPSGINKGGGAAKKNNSSAAKVAADLLRNQQQLLELQAKAAELEGDGAKAMEIRAGIQDTILKGKLAEINNNATLSAQDKIRLSDSLKALAAEENRIQQLAIEKNFQDQSYNNAIAIVQAQAQEAALRGDGLGYSQLSAQADGLILEHKIAQIQASSTLTGEAKARLIAETQALAIQKQKNVALAQEKAFRATMFQNQQTILELQAKQAELSGNIALAEQIRLQASNQLLANKIAEVRASTVLTEQQKEQEISDLNRMDALNKQNGLMDKQNQNAEILSGFLVDMWNDPAATMKKFFADLLKNLLTAILKATILGDKLGGGGGVGGFLGGILKSTLGFMAGGGPVSSGKPYIVGEREPELFVPNRSGQILNQRQMAGMGGSGGVAFAATYNIQLSGNAAQDSQTLAEIKQQQAQQNANIRYQSKATTWSGR